MCRRILFTLPLFSACKLRNVTTGTALMDTLSKDLSYQLSLIKIERFLTSKRSIFHEELCTCTQKNISYKKVSILQSLRENVTFIALAPSQIGLYLSARPLLSKLNNLTDTGKKLTLSGLNTNLMRNCCFELIP